MDLSFLEFEPLIERLSGPGGMRELILKSIKSGSCWKFIGAVLIIQDFHHHEALVHPTIEFYMTYFSMEIRNPSFRKLVTCRIAQFWDSSNLKK